MIFPPQPDKLWAATKAHGIDVLSIQEHDYKQQEGEGHSNAMQPLNESLKRFLSTNWEMVATLADTPRSGVAMFWKKDKFKYIKHQQLEQRILLTILQDDDGVKWTIINAHFHNDAGPRKQQWDKVVTEVPKIAQGNVVLLADHNSVLDTALDQHPSAIVEPSHKAKSREWEHAAYADLQILDAWPIIHEVELEVPEGK